MGDELVGQAVQGRAPADADDVPVLDDFIDIGSAALAYVFLDLFFVFDRGVGDADIAQAVNGGDFLGQLALVFDGVEDSMRTKPMSLAYCKSRDTDGRDSCSSLAISAWLKPDW